MKSRLHWSAKSLAKTCQRNHSHRSHRRPEYQVLEPASRLLHLCSSAHACQTRRGQHYWLWLLRNHRSAFHYSMRLNSPRHPTISMQGPAWRCPALQTGGVGARGLTSSRILQLREATATDQTDTWIVRPSGFCNRVPTHPESYRTPGRATWTATRSARRRGSSIGWQPAECHSCCCSSPSRSCPWLQCHHLEELMMLPGAALTHNHVLFSPVSSLG